MLKNLVTLHLILPISTLKPLCRSCISVLLSKRQKEQLTGGQPHAENIFGHPTGVRQIGLKPHRDLMHQQGTSECRATTWLWRSVMSWDQGGTEYVLWHFPPCPWMLQELPPSVRHVSPGGVQGPSMQTVSLQNCHALQSGRACSFLYFPQQGVIHAHDCGHVRKGNFQFRAYMHTFFCHWCARRHDPPFNHTWPQAVS